MQKIAIILLATLAFMGCGANKGNNGTSEEGAAGSAESATARADFRADSAYSYLKRQVDFGPRVPNTAAHRQCGAWLTGELRRHGAKVTEQAAVLDAFDGTRLNAVNIFGQYNPEATERILLLAHWDCRPWADQDADAANHKTPVDGANDGASGVAVLLEIARQLSLSAPAKGIDILFVDAEDWGTEGDDQSWALGTRYFVEHPPVDGYMPKEAILLDMVGGKDATFCREYFSEHAAPELAQALWATAATAGYEGLFLNRLGGAVTDDHVQLIEHGIPAVDIIEYHPEGESGFNPHWHTLGDNLSNIDPATLSAVGEVVMAYLRSNY